MAVINHYLARQAEKDNPPQGRFVEAEGVRLHYVSKGSGPAVVFLHGNGSMIQDFECSGLMDSAAERYRVVAFDRPGFGHSARPAGRAWTPGEQADLFSEALDQLGITSVVVFGHSWSTLVALELAVRSPEKVTGLVLASGYFFPSPRADIAVASVGAIPGFGRLLCHTALPLIGSLAWGRLIKNLFSPRAVPRAFRSFPKEMALRPTQLRASAQETALIIPSSNGLVAACRNLAVPVAIVCGAGDQVVDPKHSAQLSKQLKSSTLTTILFNGHMVHHTARDQVLAAIDTVCAAGAA
jgi:pimeloyl-ACP methyl ester carboxylesterase